uniref:Uncharacterized protein n=1 Tax=Anguilla anguilla TaxID=7936 RepID=A0A0E9SYY5_ANGAN
MQATHSQAGGNGFIWPFPHRWCKCSLG